MKKIKSLLIILILGVSLAGCSNLYTNEIHNKSYNVDIDITNLDELFEAAIEKAAPAVVGVTNKQFGDIQSTGSGVIYKCKTHYKEESNKGPVDYCDVESDDVLIYEYFLVTNKHVVEGKNRNFEVYLGDEDKDIKATLMAVDSKVDIAVMRFKHTTPITPLEFGDSNQLKRGKIIIAIGHPGYDYYGTSTFGIVSHPKRYMKDNIDEEGISSWDAEYIQHDAAINPGNSGGALITLEGKVVGINTLKLASDKIDNMGFAIPSNVVTNLIPELEIGEVPKRITLGVSGLEVRSVIKDRERFAENPNNQIILDVIDSSNVDFGMYINNVNEGSLGEKSGLKPGDIIIEADGIKITRTYKIRDVLNNYRLESGKVIVFKVIRDNQEQIINVIIP